jgi:hypothetical protein
VTRVCLTASALRYPEGGGHLWVFLNWALGLQANGCEVVWLEAIKPSAPICEVREQLALLKRSLAPFGLAGRIALLSRGPEPLAPELREECLPEEAATEADLLINQRYGASPEFLGRFKRTALLDIDPGLLQTWMGRGDIRLAPHDVYFTIGETVGQPGARFPDGGIAWQYTPPAVALEAWPVTPAAGPLTTVSHWYMDEWEKDPDGTVYSNDKRTGFLPYLDLPGQVDVPLELALCLRGDQRERAELETRGWRVREAAEVSAGPEAYRRYIQGSRGEFSCVKPSCVRLQNAWISDRTICYLASGKPAVVEHTGPSRFLPDAAGLFRFRTPEEAARHLRAVAAEYDQHSRAARALAETYFDARKTAGSLLERALA